MRSLFALLPFAVALFAGVFATSVAAQPNPWQAFPSLRNAQALSASDDAIWVGTDGGVYRYTVASGEIERYTPVKGLSGVDARAIAYDERRGAVWVGYPDGVIDRLDIESEAVETFVDIARADQFNSRTINRIEVEGDSLWIATGFGLVVFDALAEEVRDTYERFGTSPAGVATFDALRAPTPSGAPGLWVGTREGVAYAPLSAPNLREPSAWTNEPDGPRNVLSLASFQGQVFAGTERVTEFVNGTLVVLEEGGVWRRAVAGDWSPLPYGTESTLELVAEPDRLLVVSAFRITVREGEGSAERYTIEGLSNFRSVVIGPDQGVWIGEGLEGLVALPDLDTIPTGTVEPRLTVVPDGPATNAVLSIETASDGTVWTGLGAPNRFVNGFSRFDGAAWTNYSFNNGALADWAAVGSIDIDPSGNVWFGSGDTNRGVGVFQYTPEGEILQYTPANSSLRPSSADNPDYVVTPGVTVDDDGRLWVTNRFANPPLHVRTPDGEWHGIPRPNGVPFAVNYDRILIDSFGQKWIAGYREGGLVVLDTGAEPLDATDDRAVYVAGPAGVGSGLPNAGVNAIAEDLSGRIWLGTDRGLATVFSPGSIFSGDPAAQITWARNPEGNGFFLRDLEILDIAIDPADRKWLASSSGAWLLSADGNEVLANFTAENSPLPSDGVLSVEVGEETGAVYFATSGGVYRYESGAVAAARESGDLFAYPNPVRGMGGGLPVVTVTGLVDESDVRVLTVDGQLVAAFETRGGSVSWDGRDQRTGDYVPSGVYLVAADSEEGTSYGKIAVIR